jgi:serine/threonine-protein kinase
MVADFGVAKALASATQGESGARAPAATVTGLGAAVGTPAYMAPEQAVGDPTTDHRADLYALGVVAYELFAGAHPFAGRSPAAMVAAHLTETAVPLAERRPDVPPPLGALVTRLLAKRPEDRPASAREVLDTLDGVQGSSFTGSPTPATAPPLERRPRLPRSRLAWAALTAAALVALVGAGSAVRGWLGARDDRAGEFGGASAAPVGIAILPFDSRGPAEDADFADGSRTRCAANSRSCRACG